MDDLACDGTEHDISACKFRGWGLNNCNHRKDVVVQCREFFFQIQLIHINAKNKFHKSCALVAVIDLIDVPNVFVFISNCHLR